jgi:hypothetical protein
VWNRLGERALSRSQCEAATSMLRWRVRTSGILAAAFITFEPNAAVASVTNLTSFRIRRRLRRRMSCHIADFGGM